MTGNLLGFVFPGKYIFFISGDTPHARQIAVEQVSLQVVINSDRLSPPDVIARTSCGLPPTRHDVTQEVAPTTSDTL